MQNNKNDQVCGSNESNKPEYLCDTCKWKHQFGLCDHPFMMGGSVDHELEYAFNLNKIQCNWYEKKIS